MEALRAHLGLDRIDLLAHCAGANLAAPYAARHPECIDKLVLITPSTRAVDITATSEMRREIVRLREAEPWFVPALTASGARQRNEEAAAVFGAEGAFEPTATRAALPPSARRCC